MEIVIPAIGKMEPESYCQMQTPLREDVWNHTSLHYHLGKFMLLKT